MLILKKWLYYIYLLCLPLLLTMTLHIHCGRWWPIVCPPSGSFLNFQKGCIPGAVRSLLMDEPVLGGTPGLRVVHCTLAGSTGFTLVLFRAEVLTCSSMLPRVYHYPPWLELHVCAYLSYYFFNKSHYWLLWMEGKKATLVVNRSNIVQEKWLCYENSCLLC